MSDQFSTGLKEWWKSALSYLPPCHSVCAYLYGSGTEWSFNSYRTLLSSPLVQLGMCLVPQHLGALGGFTYSCHVYTLAKQGLRTLQGGTEEGAKGEVVWSDGWSPWFRGCWYRADSPGSVTDSLWVTLHKSLHLKCPHVFRSVQVEISRTDTAGNRYWVWFSCFSLAFPWSFHKQMAEAH